MDTRLEGLRERIRKEASLLAQPIDLEDLIARGVLSKAGRGWYAVRSRTSFPRTPVHRSWTSREADG